MSVGDVQQMFSSIIFWDILRFIRGLPVEKGKEKGGEGEEREELHDGPNWTENG